MKYTAALDSAKYNARVNNIPYMIIKHRNHILKYDVYYVFVYDHRASGFTAIAYPDGTIL